MQNVYKILFSVKNVGEVRGLTFGKNIELVIADLNEGEEGWTVVDALELHYDYNPYLYLEKPISKFCDRKNGKVLRVKRIGPKKDDFIVFADEVYNYLWKRYFLEPDDFECDSLEMGIAILDYKKQKTNEDRLQEAVNNENYTLAAKIRDRMKKNF